MDRFIAQLNNCTDTISRNCDTTLPTVAADQQTLQTFLQIFFGAIGAITVIIIIISGIKMIIAQGDPQGIAKARQTLIYAVIGLAVVISAEIIVTFVVGAL